MSSTVRRLKTEMIVAVLDWCETRGGEVFTTHEAEQAFAKVSKATIVRILVRLVNFGNIRSCGEKKVMVPDGDRKRPCASYRFVGREVKRVVPKPGTVDYAIYIYGHDEDFRPRSAETPTAALPRSVEKIAVLASRVANGEDLWHPEDATNGFARPNEIPVEYRYDEDRFNIREFVVRSARRRVQIF